MIKISSYFPFSSFLRITQEFYEEKAIVKTKSLTAEQEFEFEYKDKEKVEKIIEFVRSKVSPATNDQLLKEQA